MIQEAREQAPQIKYTQMRITPDMAKGWLDAQHANRDLNRALVAQLARAIKENRWEVTHQGIAFDDQGILVDGQHRLQAILDTGIPVNMMCAFGVSRNTAIRAVDQGAKRTMAQLGAMRGEKYAATKSAICHALGIATLGIGLTAKFDPMDFELLLDEYRTEIDRILDIPKIPGFRSAMMAGVVLALRGPRGEEFFAGVTTGANLTEGDPRLVLRSSMPARRGRAGHLQVDELLRTIHAAHAFARGEAIKRMTMSGRRLKEFCADVKIPVNPYLLAYADGYNEGRGIPTSAR